MHTNAHTLRNHLRLVPKGAESTKGPAPTDEPANIDAAFGRAVMCFDEIAESLSVRERATLMQSIRRHLAIRLACMAEQPALLP